MIDVDLKETIKQDCKYSEALKQHKQAWARHYLNGMHEANDDLNNSNRKLIKAYVEEFPAAVCLQISPLELFRPSEKEHLYNFCCNYIFDGSNGNLEKVQNAAELFNKTTSIENLNNLERILKRSNCHVLVWS